MTPTVPAGGLRRQAAGPGPSGSPAHACMRDTDAALRRHGWFAPVGGTGWAMHLARLRRTLVALLAVLVWAPIAARAEDPGGTPAPVVVNVTVQVGTPAPPAPAGAPAPATAATGGVAQSAPVNVAVQVVVNSPGAAVTAEQANTATGGV